MGEGGTKTQKRMSAVELGGELILKFDCENAQSRLRGEGCEEIEKTDAQFRCRSIAVQERMFVCPSTPSPVMARISGPSK